MPRPSNSAKRQQGATNVRDTRHENGLVGPGKRVLKRKSQNQLDGGPSPAADNGVAPPMPPLPPNATAFAQHSDDVLPEHRATEVLRRASLGTYSESSSTESLPVSSTIAISEENHRHIDVNDAKNTSVHKDTGPLDFALNVLQSCPMHDTVAILIILLQVSPAALTTIYMLFTLLTFVPPVTTSSGLSFAEIFDGNQGTPSLTTLICMDVIILAIWLFLWPPLQQYILNLAMVVIALTLGGGGSSTPKNIIFCVVFVGVQQFTQFPKWNRLSKLALFGSNRLFDPMSVSPTTRTFEKRSPYGWVQSVFAIHILTQGIVRYIREWYLRRERRDLQLQTQLDPEAGKSVSFSNEGSSDAAIMAADSDAHLQTTVSTKKKRRQSAQVRIRQPLWAALASTKIVMVKEYELQHAASESAGGTNATDIHNLGNAPFNTQPEQIWICYVGCDEVCFNTSHFPDPAPQDDEGEDDNKPGIDATKPFYVRVNNAIWQATRINPIDVGEEESHQGTRWTGDIYGLTPFSNYEFEFVSTRTGKVIFSTSVRTVQAKSKDPEAAKTPGNQQRTSYDSPATTLRASIAAAEVKLADEKARLKAVRKDNNRKVNATKKEIEKLAAAVQSAGGDDEKLRQKAAQNKIQEKRAEEYIYSIELGLKELETLPEELVEKHRQKQKEFAESRAKYEKARAGFKVFKSGIDGEYRFLDEEKAALQAKRNKIAARLAKVDNEHARITDANAQGMGEAERRHQQRVLMEMDMHRVEQQMLERISSTRAQNVAKQDILDMATQTWLSGTYHQPEVIGYDQMAPAITAPPITAPQYSAAPAHWGLQATAGPYNSHSMWSSTSMQPQAPALLPPAQFSSFVNPLQNVAETPPRQKVRGRSSSMLSDVSGFTQSTDGGEMGNGYVSTTPFAASDNSHSHPPIGHGHGTPGSTILRGPSGFHFAHPRGDGGFGSGSASGSGSGSGVGTASASGSGSGSGSGRSSVRSGSGSCGSFKDPASPV